MSTPSESQEPGGHSALTSALIRSGVALLYGCAIIWLVETLYVAFALESLPTAVVQRGQLTFIAGVMAVSGVVFLLNAAIPVVLGHVLHRRVSWWRLFPVVLGGAFGFLWQETIIHGDGLVSRPNYEVIRIVSGVVATVGGAGFAGFLAWFPERSESIDSRTVPLMAVLAGSIYVNAAVLPRYVEFHGYLAAFNGLFAAWIVWPLLERDVLRRAGYAVGAVLMLATATTYVGSPELLRYVKRFGHTPRAMASNLPVTDQLEKVLEFEGVMGPMSAEQVADHLPLEARRGDFEHRRGRNILLIVLESTRSDTWNSPDVTPQFHAYKSSGSYFPRAVAQYPATPLAYGAMFTSQPPEVLVESPYWGVERPFAPVAAEFDRIIATRPDVSWFDTNAIQDFFLPPSVEPSRHEDARQGLDHVRAQIEEHPRESFFAWAHLYEPHQPWDRRPEFAEGTGKAAAHRSEVAYVDAELGRFFEWFDAQPVSKDTLVVVVSDHGEGLGEVIDGSPYWGHHVHVRNVVSHIPLFVRGPDIPRKGTLDAFSVQQIDLLPTFYDFVGVQPERELLIQGTSIYALIDAPRPRALVTQAFSFRGHAFFDFVGKAKQMHPADLRRAFDKATITSSRYAPKVALEHGRYKIIRDEWLETTELYDIADDPGETRDLSDAKPDILRAMEDRLDAWKLRQRAVIQRLNRTMQSSPSD